MVLTRIAPTDLKLFEIIVIKEDNDPIEEKNNQVIRDHHSITGIYSSIYLVITEMLPIMYNAITQALTFTST